MKLPRLFLALSLGTLLCGCGPADSLNPLYSGQDITFDAALLGQWESDGVEFNFAKVANNGYRLVMSEKDSETGQQTTTVLDAHLVSIQGHRFLDVACNESPQDWPAIPEVRMKRTPDGVKIEPHLLFVGCTYLELLPGESNSDEDSFTMRPRPVHWFFKVEMEDEKTLGLVQLSDSWVESQIQEGKLALDHEVVEGKSTVLTASTAELQQMVLDHVNDDEAFCGATLMKRPGSD
jgi:hypothetical protein